MYFRIFILVVCITCFSSCRYEKPFISVTWLYRLHTDTLTKLTKGAGVFNYISFKNGLSKGVGTFHKVYNANGVLIYSDLLKEGHANSTHRKNTQYIKEVVYDSLGKIKSIHYQKKQIKEGKIKIFVDKTLTLK